MKDFINLILGNTSDNSEKSNQKGNFPLIGFLVNEHKVLFEKTIGIKMKNIAYYEQALIHRSYAAIPINSIYFSNERLEFLGDAVLDMVVADFLFNEFSSLDEGKLTERRAILVKKKTLAYVAKKLELDKFVKLSYSAEKALGSGSDSILADALESIIGAIYLDLGFTKTKKFILKSYIPIANDRIGEEINYKSQLLELVQSKGSEAPKYQVLEEKGPDHHKEFVIGVFVADKMLAKGVGKNKKSAEQNAAYIALNHLTL